MIINKKITFLSLTLIVLFSLALSVSAETGSSRLTEREGAVTSVDDEFDFDEEALDESLDDLEETLSDIDTKTNDDDESGDDIADDDDDRSKGDKHRNDVADIMKELEKLADLDDEVEDDIDEVVKEQRELEEKTAKALDEVEKRDGLRTFFFGTDYKNIGELRSTVVSTENHIDRLQKAVERTDDATVRAELTAQIQALRDTASSTEVFIRDNEGKFSLFGWLVRAFQD